MRPRLASAVLPKWHSILRAGGLGAALLLAAFPAAAQTVSNPEFPAHSPVTEPTNPFDIAPAPPGPDGNFLWFTQTYGPGKVGRISAADPANGLSEFDTGYSLGIVAGSDGNMWFTGGHAGQKIGRITTAGVVTEFNPPFTGGPQFVTTGPDGALWFTESNRVARMFPSDPSTVVEYPVVGTVSTLGWIKPGPDVNTVWFTEANFYANERIAKIDLRLLDGCSSNPSLCITEYEVPVAYGGGITAGPGGVWFTGPGQVGQITIDGVITMYNADGASAQGSITLGSDGNLWYSGGNVIGRITPAGVVTTFPVRSGFSPRGITAGPDGNVWFTDISGNKIGRVDLGGSVPAPVRGHVIPLAAPAPQPIASPRP